MGHLNDHETLDALAGALDRNEAVTAATVHTPQTRADWVELLVTPPTLSPALLREIADHDCEVTELTRESSVGGAGPGIGMVSIQRAAQQCGAVDDSEGSEDSESDTNESESEEIERNDNDGNDTNGSDMIENDCDGDDDPDESLAALTDALEALDAVLSVDLHAEESREEYSALTTDNTRLDEMFATEMDRLDQEGRAWIELVADGTLLSPAILRTIGEHDAGVSEVIHMGEHFSAAAIRGAD
jgi:hypothetical protein